MKRFFVLTLAMLMVLGSLVAQSSNNVDEVVKIERYAAKAYRDGEMIVKFKPASVKRLRSLTRGVTSGINELDKVFEELGVTASEQLMPLSGATVTPHAKARRSVSGKPIVDSDMSQLYRLIFDAKKVNVHQAVEKFAALEEVEFAEPNYIAYALSTGEEVAGDDKIDDPLSAEQWGHGQLKLNFLWKQKPITDNRPVIAILDTGIDIEHPDLKDNIWTNEAELNGAEEEDDDANGFADDLHGWDFVNQTARIGDWNGHGTHCAGIAAAVGDNKIGITGANPDALIMPITVMQSDGTGDIATIIKGIDYAAANGADVISMSIGGYGYSLAEEQALAKAYATAVLVAAAGNDGHDMCGHHCIFDAPMFPAAFTFVLGVEAGTQDGGLAAFSNYDCNGPIFSLFNEEQLYNYELRAPGVGIMSTYPGGKYKKLNGTSMACPYVAGGISRLLQVKEYSNWEILFGDLIHARKKSTNQLVDFEAAYKITDADRKPTLGMVTYNLKDTIEGDGDSRPDAGETIAFYPTLRNEWGQAENIKFSLELGENEDPSIVEFLDNGVDFGKQLSSYAKNISANPIRIKINEKCVDGRHIRLVLRATCDNITEELVQEFTLTAENGVEIGGMITEDMTLYPNVHYIVTQPLAVPKGVKLTIKPGTVLKFKDYVQFRCEGDLICKGTPDSLIVFTMATGCYNWAGFTSNNKDTLEYVKFCDIEEASSTSSDWGDRGLSPFHGIFKNTIFENICHNQADISCWATTILLYSNIAQNQFITYNFRGENLFFYKTNIASCKSKNTLHDMTFGSLYMANSCNIVSNTLDDEIYNTSYRSNKIALFKNTNPSYWGSSKEEIVRKGIIDMYHPYGVGFGVVDLSNMLTRPSAEAHGIVWKVVVNGYDAQDEFEQLPPLGVGKHKFEVYFNRPMDTSVTPMIAMGVRPPYTSHTIAEDGSWNEEGTIYTAYLTITGKTGADGLNRIYVSDAEDNEHFEIPVENMRFNVQVAAAGSMATGLMAEAGLGKVSLNWETDEEDFEDLLGYNIYRYTEVEDSMYVDYDENWNWIGEWKHFTRMDTIIVNSNVIDSEETSFVDYDVVPGTTYYYVIKQLTTSLNSYALSNAVAATPLAAQKGDANGSMSVDIADVVTEVAYITYQDPQPFIFEAADVNSDQKVNVLDIVGTIGIIVNPADAGVSSLYNEPVRYFVKNGVLYMENVQPLGGIQVRLHAQKGIEITSMDDLKGMEQTSVWTSESEYLFLAYSMSGKTILPGTHALLKIGDEALITEMVVSDAKGRNIPSISGDATDIEAVKAATLNIPSPNPFTTQLNVPYIIGMSGNHEVVLTFTDLTGRVIDTYCTISAQGEHVYTWHPGALQGGLYFVTLHVDGKMIQTAKVICNN